MAADVPIVRYNDGSPEKPTKAKMDAVADRWLAKKKGKTLKGEKISLSEWIRNDK